MFRKATEVLLLLAIGTGVGAYVGLMQSELERTEQALQHARQRAFAAHQTVHAQDADIAQATEENAALAEEVSRLERAARKNGRAARLLRDNDCRADDPLCGIPLNVLDRAP